MKTARIQVRGVLGACAVALSLAAAPTLAQVKLPSTLAWSAYDVGSAGYNQSVGIGNALKQKYNVSLRVLPGKNDVSRNLPLRNGQVQFSANGVGGAYLAQEGMYDFGAKDWGPQPVRGLMLNTSDQLLTVLAAKDSGIKTVADLKGKRVAWVIGAPSLNQNITAILAFANLTWDGVVATPSITYEIEALANQWFAAGEEDQWVDIVLVNGATGVLGDTLSWFVYEAALDADGAGTSLFVGEAHLSGSNLFRYDVGAGTFTLVDETDYDSGYGFPYPSRHVAVAPDASGVFYAGWYLDGSDLSVLEYQMTAEIRTVTDTLAISATTVYDLATGTSLGSLSTTGAVQAASPDGTSLYVASGGTIHLVDLSGY